MGGADEMCVVWYLFYFSCWQDNGVDSAKKNTYTAVISVRSPSRGRNFKKRASPAQKTSSLESDGWGRIVTRGDLRYIDITLRFHFGRLWCSAPSSALLPSSEQANVCSNPNVTTACRTPRSSCGQDPTFPCNDRALTPECRMHVKQLNRVFYSAAPVVLCNPARPLQHLCFPHVGIHHCTGEGWI